MFIFPTVSGKKGWVIQRAAFASGLGPGSVSTLFFFPPGTCVSLGRSCLSPPTFSLSFQQGSPRGVRDLTPVKKKKPQKTKGRGGNKGGKVPPRNEKRERVRSPRKASLVLTVLHSQLLPGTPTHCVRVVGEGTKVTRRYLSGLPVSTTALPAVRSPAGIRGPDL